MNNYIISPNFPINSNHSRKGNGEKQEHSSQEIVVLLKNREFLHDFS